MKYEPDYIMTIDELVQGIFVWMLMVVICIVIWFLAFAAIAAADQGAVYASYYSRLSPGIKQTTANMEIFDDTALTAAMWEVPFHTKVLVTNLRNRKSVLVRINDRGPAKRLVREGRVIDLSKAAFEKIALLEEGVIPVEVTYVE